MLLITIKENIKVHHRASYDRNVCRRYSSSLLRQQTAFIIFVKMVPQENKYGSFLQQNLTNMPLSQGDQLQLMKSPQTKIRQKKVCSKIQHTFNFLNVALSFTLVLQNATVHCTNKPSSLTFHTFLLHCSLKTVQGKSVFLGRL